MKENPAYRNWQQMLSRGLGRETEERYANYEKNGITVHPDFLDFNVWLAEIGPKPEGEGWTIGRKDNFSGYVYGNMRWETPAQQARNHCMQRNNTSGETGVQVKWTTTKGTRYKGYIATWYELDGRRHWKHFGCLRYGEAEAFALATKYRKEQIERLNAQGADYAATHGLKKT